MAFLLATPRSELYRDLRYNANRFPLSDAYVGNMYIVDNGVSSFGQLDGLGQVEIAVTLSLFALNFLKGILPSSPTVKIENMSEWENQVLKKGTPPTQQGKFMLWTGGIPKTHIKVLVVFSKALLKGINTWSKWLTFKRKLESYGIKNVDYRFEVWNKPHSWTVMMPPPVMLHKNYMSKGIKGRTRWMGGRTYHAMFTAIHVKPPEVAAAPTYPPETIMEEPSGFDAMSLLLPATIAIGVGGLAFILLRKKGGK